jgi:hypothetical protein
MLAFFIATKNQQLYSESANWNMKKVGVPGTGGVTVIFKCDAIRTIRYCTQTQSNMELLL